MLIVVQFGASIGPKGSKWSHLNQSSQARTSLVGSGRRICLSYVGDPDGSTGLVSPLSFRSLGSCLGLVSSYSVIVGFILSLRLSAMAPASFVGLVEICSYNHHHHHRLRPCPHEHHPLLHLGLNA
ncbi:hypothetical protein CDL15_Pgr022531 [Punica granatum]|uniref:Uncharacterized protein n=1 Tax=Punica granatum TaxID=22663 RepID=A0A218XRH1_PUNGR|nr:hypothetical protein CDL15_Pgr022531 [Punica granatum]